MCQCINEYRWFIPWWRHQMETFSALLAICAENSPVPGEFAAQRPVTQSFDVSFDLRLQKRLSKQWWGWWFETLSHPLWRHRNAMTCRLPSAKLLPIPAQTYWQLDLQEHMSKNLVQNVQIAYAKMSSAKYQSFVDPLVLTLYAVFNSH